VFARMEAASGCMVVTWRGWENMFFVMIYIRQGISFVLCYFSSIWGEIDP